MHILQAWKTEHRLFHALLIALDLSLSRPNKNETLKWRQKQNNQYETKHVQFQVKRRTNDIFACARSFVCPQQQ